MLGPVPLRTTKKTFPGLLLCAAALVGVGAAACADQHDDELDADFAEDGDTQELALQHSVSGVRFVSVTANGSGCPRGSWRASTGRDGEVSLRFSSFAGETGRNRRTVIKDCSLGIRLDGGESVSLALADVRTSGRARLRDGSDLVVSSQAYWQGNPSQSITSEISLRESDSFTLGEAIPESARVWSPCGKQRDLNIITRARLQSSGDSYGYFDISRIGDLKIAVKRCGDAQPDGGALPPDGGTPPPDGGLDAGQDGGGTPPDSGVPPTGLTVTRVGTNGTGCPAGTATSTISPDGQTFTVAFTQLSATADDTTRTGIKDCNLAISVANPTGQSYGLEAINFKGTSKLAEGARAVLTSNYYFQGNPQVSDNEVTATLTGPTDGAFDVTQTFAPTAPAAPCGVERNLNSILRLRVYQGTAGTTSTATVGSAGSATFRLRPCP